MRNESRAEHLARATLGRAPEAVKAALARQDARRSGGGAGEVTLSDSRKILELGAAMKSMEAAREPLPLLTEEDIQVLIRPGAAPAAMLRAKLKQQRNKMEASGSVQAGAGTVARPASLALIGAGPFTDQLRAIVGTTGSAFGAPRGLR